MTQSTPNPKIIKPKVSYPSDTVEKYILVSFPEVQDFMIHPRWNECILCSSIEGHECPDSTYAVPENLYNEVYYK